MAPYRKAIILAGGRGTRFGSLGTVLPKCLVSVFSKPLLIHQIEQCAAAGIEDILVSVAVQFEPTVRSVLSLYPRSRSLAIACVGEEEPRGPIAGLLSLVPRLEGDAVLVLLGDEYYEHSAPFLSLAHRAIGPDLLLGVVRDSAEHRILCSVETDAAGRILRVLEKPARGQIIGRTRWCGCAGFSAGLLDSAPPAAMVQGCHLGDLLSFLIAQGANAGSLEFGEEHLNLNTPEDALAASLLEARKHYRRDGRPLQGAVEEMVRVLVAAR